MFFNVRGFFNRVLYHSFKRKFFWKNQWAHRKTHFYLITCLLSKLKKKKTFITNRYKLHLTDENKLVNWKIYFCSSCLAASKRCAFFFSNSTSSTVNVLIRSKRAACFSFNSMVGSSNGFCSENLRDALCGSNFAKIVKIKITNFFFAYKSPHKKLSKKKKCYD